MALSKDEKKFVTTVGLIMVLVACVIAIGVGRGRELATGKARKPAREGRISAIRKAITGETKNQENPPQETRNP